MAAPSPRVEILPAMAAGAGFLPLAWRSAWPALSLACVAFGLWLSAPRDLMLGGLALMALWVAQGALWRIAFDWILHRRGLHIGQVEWRLAACGMLAAAFLAIVALLTLLALMAAAYGVAAASPGFSPSRPETWAAAARGRAAGLLGALALLAVFTIVVAATRICLAGAATAALGRVQVLATWARTRGQTGRLLAVLVLAGAAPLALLVAAAFWARTAPAGAAITGAAGAAALALWLPLHAGCAAHAWRRLAPAKSEQAGR